MRRNSFRLRARLRGLFADLQLAVSEADLDAALLLAQLDLEVLGPDHGLVGHAAAQFRRFGQALAGNFAARTQLADLALALHLAGRGHGQI